MKMYIKTRLKWGRERTVWINKLLNNNIIGSWYIKIPETLLVRTQLVLIQNFCNTPQKCFCNSGQAQLPTMQNTIQGTRRPHKCEKDGRQREKVTDLWVTRDRRPGTLTSEKESQGSAKVNRAVDLEALRYSPHGLHGSAIAAPTLVLGCIDADVGDQRVIFRRFSRSTRFSQLENQKFSRMTSKLVVT